MSTLHNIIQHFKLIQDEICTGLEWLDGGASFVCDKWSREEGGGGDTRVILNGQVFEKGGVNFSHVFGKMPDILKTDTHQGNYFHATGVSIVIHPFNPYVPIIHMNIRYFEMSDVIDGPVNDSWFGGGIDLSPAYPNELDTKFFHQQLKSICDNHDKHYYESFKPWCDEYFLIRHRQEMRGVGGIFFDHLRPSENKNDGELSAFVLGLGNGFLPIYAEIVHRNKERKYVDFQKQWQYIRRGRYAEFNLVYDRGTTFGLKTNGRVESILMSLPPRAEWLYDHHPAPGSEEALALALFQPINWI